MFRDVLVIIMFIIASWLQNGYKNSGNVEKICIFLKKLALKKPENMLSHTTDYLALIREGGRTVGSGRVATIIE